MKEISPFPSCCDTCRNRDTCGYQVRNSRKLSLQTNKTEWRGRTKDDSFVFESIGDSCDKHQSQLNVVGESVQPGCRTLTPVDSQAPHSCLLTPFHEMGREVEG